MSASPEVTVLRLGHRPGRDERMSTHVGLTARALGADRAIIVGEAQSCKRSIDDVTDRFGGPFSVEVATDPRAILREWEGDIIHLTMYGEPIQATVEQVRRAYFERNRSLLIVVGAGKVGFDVYDAADWNISITNQPHSEVASLAILLDRLFEGTELDREWSGGTHRIIPKSSGKRVVPTDDGLD